MENVAKATSGAKFRGVFHVTCFRPDGTIRWEERVPNLLPNVMLNHILDVVYHGTTQVSPWYIGLKNSGSPAAGDTMASHAGWAENQNYSEATRQEFVEAAASSQSITNSANKAAFSINADSQSIAGLFLCSDSTKGGTSGTLGCATDFASAKAADNGDTLQVSYTVSAADDGA